MNERITLLALKASNPKTGWLDRQKFAELIVRECIEQGKQIQLQTVSNGSKDYVDGREMGIEVFMSQIKKHFGVEE